MARLGNYVIVQPKSKVKAGEGLIEGKYKFFTSSNTQTKWLNEFYYDKPALIFGTGGMASVHYCDTPFSTSTDCIVMYAKDSTNLEYIYHYLESHMEVLEDGFKGAGLKHISKDYILNIQIPEKELLEQKKIVDLCNNIDLIVAASKKQLEKLDELVKSRFIEMFGDPVSNPMKWGTTSLKKASVRLSDGPFGSNLKSEHYTDDGVRVIRLGNIGVGEFVNNDKSFISFEHYETIKKYTCKTGEIVIGTLGDPNLRACIVPNYIEFAINKADCVHYIPNSKFLNTKFVCQYINCPETFVLASNMVHGQTRTRISSGQLAKLPIYIPPIDLQNEFATFAEQTDKSKLSIQQSLDKLETIKKALMQQYFG